MFHSYLTRRQSLILSALALIVVNAIPILGVLFRDWNVGNLLFLYWAESITVGIFAMLRMGTVADHVRPISQFSSKRGVLMFFPLHFGAFMLIHLAFLFFFFGPPDFGWQEGAVLLTSFFVSHGSSFVMNYIIGREFKATTHEAEMWRPYSRIWVMGLTLILGAVLVAIFGEFSMMLVFMVLLKTGIDLHSHIRNHSRYNVNAQRPITGTWEQPGNLPV